MRWWVGILVLSGCSFSGSTGVEGGDGDGDSEQVPEEIAYVSASGTVVDFLTGDPVTDLTIKAVDLAGGSEVEINGADFVVSKILPHSVFRLEVSSATHATTISAVIGVEDTDVAGLTLEVVSSTLIDDAYDTAGIGRAGGVLVSRLFDADTAAPVEGVAADAFAIGEAVVFLDSTRQVSDVAPASTSSGIALILNVPPGLREIESAAAEHSFIAAPTRVVNGVASIVDIEVGGEPPQIPTGVDFETDVMPIFARQGCENCHQGDGPGRKQGGFSLNGDAPARYGAVFARVDVDNPEDSLLLRKPRFEDPWDGHQIVFATRADPDYLTMLGWIMEGAPSN